MAAGVNDWFSKIAEAQIISPTWPNLENVLPELKTVLPNACLRQGFGRQADFVIEGLR